MILITTALRCEANPIISFLKLTRVSDEKKWELYGNCEDILLLITGVGPVAAASAVSAIMTAYGFSEGDFLLNIGSCCDPGASDGENGRIFLINKLTDGETDRDFYPDMSIAVGISERSLVSVAKPVLLKEEALPLKECLQENPALKNLWQKEHGPLYDMEAAFIYQTAKYYIGPSQMAFLKIVSDNGLKDGGASFAGLESLIEKCVFQQEAVIRSFLDEIRGKQGKKPCETQEADISSLAKAFHATQTMEKMLGQLIKYANCANIDYQPMIDKMYAEGLLPALNKRDGMLALKHLERELTV